VCILAPRLLQCICVRMCVPCMSSACRSCLRPQSCVCCRPSCASRLNRVCVLSSHSYGILSLFRGYNIDSLVVCATELPEISRATIVRPHTIRASLSPPVLCPLLYAALCFLLATGYSLLADLSIRPAVLCSLSALSLSLATTSLFWSLPLLLPFLAFSISSLSPSRRPASVS
jgi:hypothetical protein